MVIRKGDPVGAFIPVPRYFVDSFDLVLAEEVVGQEAITTELQAGIIFSEQRQGPDRDKPHQAGRQYYRGIDSLGCPFRDHQMKVKK